MDEVREIGEKNNVVMDIEQNQNEHKLKKSQLFIILLGLILGSFVAGMDETILSTAVEAITRDLKSEGMLTWIATSYMLTIVMFTPLYGKLSDIFGRKVCILFSATIFSIGSLGCALSNNIILFLIFRAISGIGGGGMISLSFIVIADIIPLKDRATYMGILNLTFAASNALGPVLGGVIVDHTTWRVIFYINLPIAFILVIITIFLMPLPWAEGTLWSKLKRVDIIGCLTLTASILLFVLGTSWGGKEYSWDSATVLVPIILSFLKFVSEPVLPMPMFTKNVLICCTAMVILGSNNFTIVYYLPFYHQYLRGTSASESGYHLAPFLVVMSIASLLSGVLSSRINSFRWPIWIGTVISSVSMGLLCLINPGIQLWQMILFPIILSFGLGFILQLAIVGSQASTPVHYVAIVTSFMNFCFNIGGTIGLAIDGAIVNNVVKSMGGVLVGGGHGSSEGSGAMDLGTVSAYFEGLKTMFYFGLGISLLSFVLSLFLTHKDLNEVEE
ncbi:MFS general substrate transporter [Conidiobolus coronatus NRRL 28638]|uniref:MFS general substrate transporter n=1 Tax=Conidiobolus coronatus (strain ATCC 28846 / CBS 209.66 / NRRL 28638) TaxID=796925 RepID=A0A137P8E9_CONC2|nr:MFS general substrate transporter [Conidiobolus coronatus NRRL 28638]|eukprot:KXN71278.1 MFS general substrate transporter [Conidiobolus coronatus NRRL 28638]